MNVKAPTEEQGFFFPNNLNFKLQSDLLVNEQESLESSFILISKKEACFLVTYISMKNFSHWYLIKYLKRCSLMGEFNVNLLCIEIIYNKFRIFKMLVITFFYPIYPLADKNSLYWQYTFKFSRMQLI